MNYQPDERFDYFLTALQRQDPSEWKWLIARFRERLMPWLMSKTTSFSSRNITTRIQFVEEVFEESLLKFYELFKTGKFTKYGDLEATIVTVAKYKLKEGFARLKKEQRWYLTDESTLVSISQQRETSNYYEQQQRRESIQLVRENLTKLKKEEQVLLTRFFAGEELQDIANDLAISPAACRKRKQRIVEKFKSIILSKLTSLMVYLLNYLSVLIGSVLAIYLNS
ncbi:MAG: RNA polymerase sigma factor [Saprospiraceae bacterium]